MMKQNKYTASAVLDVDGVLCDFEALACEAFGHKNRHLYSLEERYPQYDPGIIQEFVNTEDNYINLSPIFGGILLLQQLKERGFYTILMTSRGKHLEAVTKAWLTLYNLEPDLLVFESDKAGGIKEWNYLGEGQSLFPNITLFVDDSVLQLQQVKKLNPEVTCLAWGQPWNTEWFPRIRYNESNYKIEANVGMGEWKYIWEK